MFTFSRRFIKSTAENQATTNLRLATTLCYEGGGGGDIVCTKTIYDNAVVGVRWGWWESMCFSGNVQWDWWWLGKGKVVFIYNGEWWYIQNYICIAVVTSLIHGFLKASLIAMRFFLSRRSIWSITSLAEISTKITHDHAGNTHSDEAYAKMFLTHIIQLTLH